MDNNTSYLNNNPIEKLKYLKTLLLKNNLSSQQINKIKKIIRDTIIQLKKIKQQQNNSRNNPSNNSRNNSSNNSRNNSSNNVTVTIPGGMDYSRTAITATATASVNSRILGVSASAAIEIRLPAASGYAAGQFFTIKDEAGNANTNNITILTTGSETIDGSTSIILESPHSAVNIYSDGSSKFFIY